MTPTFPAPGDTRRIIQEDIEWCDIWLPHLNEQQLAHVLLIGDSITRAYYPEVEHLLEGRAFVGRVATSRSVGDPCLVKELEAALSQNQFDVIHFNNGMHGWGYSEAEYERYFPELLEVLLAKAPRARLIWASITPVRVAGALEQLEERTPRVQQRNAIAARFVQARGIPTNDLFALARAEHFSDDGVHFNLRGTTVQAEQVAHFVGVALAALE